MDGAILRRTLMELLQGGQAHATVEAALEGLEPRLRTLRPEKDVPSVYEELVHMRIAQEDILRYTLDPSWQSPEWPEGYWPSAGEEVTEERWNQELSRFFGDLEETVRFVGNERVDLTKRIPHGEGRTYLRQVLLIADHNAYHAGQIVQARKLLKSWDR